MKIVLMLIFNHPLRRFLNFLNDGPFWQKRWLPMGKTWSSMIMVCEAFEVPRDPSAKSKDSDPDWRINWNWVLLRSTGGIVCRPLYFNRSHARSGMWLLQPIRTRLFAMRVGSKPFWLFTLNVTGKGCSLELYSTEEGQKYALKTKDEIEYISKMSGHKVTFI